MAESSVKEESIIKEGFIDKYYCYKLSKCEDYLSVYKSLLSDKCSIVSFKIENYDEIEHFTKVDFDNFVDSETIKLAENISRDIQTHLLDEGCGSELTVTVHPCIARESDESKNRYCFDGEVETISLNIPFPLSDFLCDSIELTKTFIKKTNVYLNKNLKFFNFNLILQPLKVIIDKEEAFINVRACIYGTGNLILQYTIPVKNVKFAKLYKIDDDLEYDTYIPKYIYDKDGSYEYSGVYKINESIKKYNEYILRKINNEISTSNKFVNYTLIDYSNIPNEFEKAGNDFNRDLFWLANSPYGYFNEQEKNKYLEFVKNRLPISLYSSLFTSTNSKTIVAYNSKRINIDELDRLNEDLRFRHNNTLIYIGPVIEIIMIKQTFYNEIASYRISNETTLKEITNNYKNIIDIKSNFFIMTFGGYGSVNRLLEYLEKNLIDFLPQENIENTINNYRELISINESEIGEKKNFIISFIAVVFSVFFGLGAIDDMTKVLDSYLKMKINYNQTHINDYVIEIWAGLILVSILFIYKYEIIKVFNKTVSYIIKVKYLITNKYSKLFKK